MRLALRQPGGDSVKFAVQFASKSFHMREQRKVRPCTALNVFEKAGLSSIPRVRLTSLPNESLAQTLPRFDAKRTGANTALCTSFTNLQST
jgi:hypothetical protein